MALSRANAYYTAFARCVFVPVVTDSELIGRLTEVLEAPLSILAGLKSPTTAEPQAMGVARASIGGSLACACLTLIQATADELRSTGSCRDARDNFSNAALSSRFTR